jgi:hypothetical protein
MDCRKARAVINDFVNNRADLKSTCEMAEHVKQCKNCREELEVCFVVYTALRQMDEGKEYSDDYVGLLGRKLKKAEKDLRTRHNYFIFKRLSVTFIIICMIAVSLTGIGSTKVLISDMEDDVGDMPEVTEAAGSSEGEKNSYDNDGSFTDNDSYDSPGTDYIILRALEKAKENGAADDDYEPWSSWKFRLLAESENGAR